MTFEQLVEIINDQTKTAYQKAADLHAALTQSTQDKPKPAQAKARKPRGPNKPKPLVLTNGTENQDVN